MNAVLASNSPVLHWCIMMKNEHETLMHHGVLKGLKVGYQLSSVKITNGDSLYVHS